MICTGETYKKVRQADVRQGRFARRPGRPVQRQPRGQRPPGDRRPRGRAGQRHRLQGADPSRDRAQRVEEEAVAPEERRRTVSTRARTAATARRSPSARARRGPRTACRATEQQRPHRGRHEHAAGRRGVHHPAGQVDRGASDVAGLTHLNLTGMESASDLEPEVGQPLGGKVHREVDGMRWHVEASQDPVASALHDRALVTVNDLPHDAIVTVQQPTPLACRRSWRSCWWSSRCR